MNSQTTEGSESCTWSSRPETPTPTRRSGPGRSRSARSSSEQASSPIRAAVVGADRERRRARADREVRVAQLRRHRARDLAAAAQVLGEPDRHPAQLVVQPLGVGDVPRERLLVRDRDALVDDLERARVDAARAVAQLPPDLAAQQRASSSSSSAARSPIVSMPARASRSSARGPTPGRSRIGNGARNAASRPGRTAVRPPGLRRSDATFATTFEVATPSEQESRGARAHDRLHRLGERTRVVERGRDLAEVEVALVDPGLLDGGDDLADRRPDLPRVVPVERVPRAHEDACGQRRSASAHDIAEWIPKPRAT